MVSHHVGVPPTDRLRVFVSSTIKECAQERAAARKAILSINHEPVLFEEVGARPYPPRDVYKPRLEASHIFVAIYRCSYGWVAPDMNISGLEDEFEIADSTGIERLVYVFAGEDSKEQALESLIEHAKHAGITIASYSEPDQLLDQIRNDVTAVVSGRFVDQVLVGHQTRDPEDVLSAALPNPSHRLRRTRIEQQVLKSLEGLDRVLIAGPLGAGKTILLAQLATAHGWVFLDGHGLTRLELMAKVANALRSRAGQAPATFPTEERARAALMMAWQEARLVTLAVDAPAELDELWGLPRGPGRLVVTARGRPEVLARQRLDLPPLSSSEIESWLTAIRGRRPEPGEVSSLLDRSAGNPLYLRFYAMGAKTDEDLSLRDLEIRAYQSLSPRAREVVSYLVLSATPLSLPTLEELLGPAVGGPESVATLVGEASILVRQSSGEVAPIHEHPRQTLLEQLRASPTRLRFFATRLGRYLEGRSDHVAAFHVYHVAAERQHADRLLDLAAHQAVMKGGGAPAIPIFRRKAERAREDNHTTQEVEALLGLAFALTQTGARAEAAGVLQSARTASASGGDPQLPRQVKEMQVILDLDGTGPAERIRALAELREEYASHDQPFDEARLATILTAEYIADGEYVVAEKTAQSALAYFESVGDEHGIRIALTNLAAAMSGIEGREGEAVTIARRLEEGFDATEYPRERAVICNLLTRRYRELGRPAVAADYATEALQIGTRLGDQHVIAINRINLGNVRRDEAHLDLALEEYRAADLVAAGGGLRRDEAAANELIASVLNEQGKHDLALIHAQHAAGAARLDNDQWIEARAEEERASALAALGRREDAVEAFAEAAIAVTAIESKASFFESVVEDGLSYCEWLERPDLKVRLLSRVFAAQEGDRQGQGVGELLAVFYAAVTTIVSKARVERAPVMVALAGAGLVNVLPGPVQRHVISQCVDALLAAGGELDEDRLVSGVVGVLLASSWECLNIADVVDLADRVSKRTTHLHFKPHPDGAGHWTLRTEIGGGVVATVTQLDDSTRTAVVAMLVALLLRCLGPAIRSSVIETESTPRTEVAIHVLGRTEFDAHVEPALSGLGDMPSGFSVTRSTDVARHDQPPIFVICDSSFGKPWHPSEHRLSDMHLLLAELLCPLSSHLLAREVEEEVLFPKIGGLVRQMGYRGKSWHGSCGKPG